MENTRYLNLKKPSYDEVADVEVLNENSDTLDTFARTRVVQNVNGVTPTNGRVDIDLGVTSVNGMVGEVTITERSVKDIIDIIYPVGSYYDTSDRAFNPNITWVGTVWERITDGRVLIAGGGTYNIGTNYGELTHKITIAELPSHNHSASVSTNGNHSHTYTTLLRANDIDRAEQNKTSLWSIDNEGIYNTSQAGNHKHTVTIGNTGSNVAMSLLQPSTAVARWHRTA